MIPLTPKQIVYSALGTLGTIVLTAAGYIASDVWTQAGRVPTLEERLSQTTQRIENRLERIESSLDMLIRLQIRRSGSEGTMVVCKDERGRVAACQEK